MLEQYLSPTGRELYRALVEAQPQSNAREAFNRGVAPEEQYAQELAWLAYCIHKHGDAGFWSSLDEARTIHGAYFADLATRTVGDVLADLDLRVDRLEASLARKPDAATLRQPY